MEDSSPVIWVIGATRSCKTALAENGIAPLGFKLISTGDYFREKYGKPDTYSRDFVFNISANSAALLAQNPDCHLDHLISTARKEKTPLVIEGERNPVEFAKLYDPKQDMVVILDRVDIEKYDTVIERGIHSIESMIRWTVSTGIALPHSAFKMTFGNEEITAAHFGTNNTDDVFFLKGHVKQRILEGDIEDKYPWINVLIGCTRERIMDYYDITINAQTPKPALSL